MVRVESAYVEVTYRRTRDLDETLACFHETDRNSRFSVAWLDALARGKSLGRSLVMLADVNTQIP